MAVSWLSVAVGCPLLSVTLPGWTGLAPARPGWDLGVQPGQPGTGLYRAVSGYTPMIKILLRHFEAWEGRNLFCCNGRIISGPDRGSLVCNICA